MTEQELISKKDLLELTGISYGQLYRWKRKNLIPEDWFIRKSTFTGQETFFPKQSILARIDKIVNMKEDLSLDELADVFSPNMTEMALTRTELDHRNIVSTETLRCFIELYGEPPIYSFDKILFLYVVDKLLHTGEMTLEEGKSLLHTLTEHYAKFEGKPFDIIFFRKMGLSGFALKSATGELYMEPKIRVVNRIPVAGCIEELILKLT